MSLKISKLEVGARSETGYVREENQDRMSGTEVPLGYLYVVADGMGGHKGGALAAELAVQELQRQLSQAHATDSVEQVIRTAFKSANESIHQKGHSGDPATEGMGTTAVLLLISDKVARVAHVGDSRAYLYRDGLLRQLTTDHTMVQKMVEAGMVKPEDAAYHPNAGILERALGTHPTVDVDISKELPLADGDAFLLCSDGLCGYVSDEEIEPVLRSHTNAQETTSRLIELALQKGGKDNVTVQFVQYGPRKQQALNDPRPPEKPAATVVPSKAENPSMPAIPTRNDAATKKDDIGRNPSSVARHFTLYVAGAFVLGAAIAAFVFFAFLHKRSGDLTAANAKVAKMGDELQNAKAAGEKAASELATLKARLGQAGESAKAAERVQSELKKTENARKNAEEQLASLKAELNKWQNDFKKSESARRTAESNAAAWKQKLEEKDRESQAAKTTKTEESRKTTSSEGAAPPKETGGTADNSGQTETPETKKN